MAKARKVVLDSNRLGKRLRELATDRYVLRQEIVVCNVNNYLDSNSYDVCGIDSDFKYPVERIEMYFYKDDSAKRLLVEAVGGVGKIVLEGIDYSKSFVESKEEYSLFDGDEIPKEVDGKQLKTFRLCLGQPIMYNMLNMYDLVLDNNFYYDVFNRYEYLSESVSYSSSKLSSLNRRYSSEINVLLVNNGYSLIGTNSYMSKRGDSRVFLNFHGDTFDVCYADRFSDLGIVNLDSCKEEFSEELIVGDFAKNVLVNPSFSSVMLNGDINNADFNLSDIDLEDLLLKLNMYHYHIEGVGVSCVSSMELCRVVCCFRGVDSYLYIQFYFDSVDCQFKIRLYSCKNKLNRIECEGVSVLIVGVDCSSEDTTTLISGFDFGNFREHSLV